MEKITSAQNSRLKAAVRLLTNRGRKQQARIIIFGAREIRRALACGLELDEIFVGREVALGAEQTEIVHRNAAKCFELPAPLFEKLAYGDRMDGVIATAPRPDTGFDQLPVQIQSGESLLICVLEAVEKPGNVGAVFRSADGAGVDAVFLANPLCDPFHPNAIRASLGTVFSTPTVCDSSSNIQDWLLSRGFQVLATRVDSTKSYAEATYTGHVAIVLGNEAQGLSESWGNSTSISIPMKGIADSLNLSTTAAILFYHANLHR